MATPRKLKVFRTSTGFHDAYVAAPSRKAALEAWGAEKDLFASGLADLVTDPALAAEALKFPGRVIRRSRGSLAEQLAALPQTKPARPPDKVAPPSPRKAKAPSPRKAKPKPRPSRARLDEVEAAVRQFEAEAEAEMSALRDREAELQRQKQALAKRQAVKADKLDQQLTKAREQYERALSKWRSDA